MYHRIDEIERENLVFEYLEEGKEGGEADWTREPLKSLEALQASKAGHEATNRKTFNEL